MLNDATKPANQRIAGMLVLGKYKDVKQKADRKLIVDTLVAQLAKPAERIAEFAAFALGLLAHKDVDAAVTAVAANAPDESKYYCLAALRDNREEMDKNSPFQPGPGAVVLTALSSSHAPTRLMAATHANWVKGDDKATLELVTKLLELLKDADAAIADAARNSIRQKVTEFLAGGAEFTTTRNGLPAVYESAQAHTRAAAVWVGHYLNNSAAEAGKIGTRVEPDLSLTLAAWEKDVNEPLVLAAVGADLGRHGDLGQKIKMVKLLSADGCHEAVAAGVREGLGAAEKDKGDPLLADAIVEALPKGSHAGAAAGRLIGVHGTKKAHVAAAIQALKAAEAANDGVAKAGLVDGLRILLNDSKASTSAEFEMLLSKSAFK
jgi:hypothetical protein